MNHAGSDLEEGEILDDLPSSPFPNSSKKLPRRYIIQDHKSTQHKHKSDCKYAIRYHAKKLAKLKKTPTRLKEKKHHKPCPSEKKHKSLFRCLNDNISVKKIVLKNSHSNKVGRKSPVKNIFGINRLYPPNTSMFDPSHSKTDSNKFHNFTEMLASNKNFQTQTQNLNKPSLDVEENSNDVVILENNHSDDIIKSNCNGSLESSNIEKVESEDEEELRRIALATCAKRNKTVEQSLENVVSNVNSNSVIPKPSEIIPLPVPSSGTRNQVFDNYEVIDMEVEDDNQSSCEIADNEDIFVIDTKPYSSCLKDLKSSLSEVQSVNCSDDDFEEDILRAELINSLCNKRSAVEVAANKEKLHVDLCSIQKPGFKLHEHNLEENAVKKGDNLIKNINKTVQKAEVNESPKRLVINLNDESSSDESDHEDAEQLNPMPENPVASIEAFITDIRQMSDSSDKTKKNVQAVPKAVSCLSKAQQEEYNSLVKILAEKKKNVPLPPVKQEVKNGVVHSPLEDFKALEKKLMSVRESLKKKKDAMSNLSKEVNDKRRIYMKSKLTAQHLKEQYVAAEKVRRDKLDAWSKSCRTLDAVRKSVTDLEKKIILLQNSCSKMSSCIQGQNYNLPSEQQNEQQ